MNLASCEELPFIIIQTGSCKTCMNHHDPEKNPRQAFNSIISESQMLVAANLLRGTFPGRSRAFPNLGHMISVRKRKGTAFLQVVLCGFMRLD